MDDNHHIEEIDPEVLSAAHSKGNIMLSYFVEINSIFFFTNLSIFKTITCCICVKICYFHLYAQKRLSTS